MGFWPWLFFALAALSLVLGVGLGVYEWWGGPPVVGAVMAIVFSFVALFGWVLPKHWHAELKQALSSMQAQGYPRIREVAKDPWLTVTFSGCGTKLNIDVFGGKWMPYKQEDGEKISLSPYYIRHIYGCGLDEQAGGGVV